MEPNDSAKEKKESYPHFIIVDAPDLKGNEQVWVKKSGLTIIFCAEETENAEQWLNGAVTAKEA